MKFTKDLENKQSLAWFFHALLDIHHKYDMATDTTYSTYCTYRYTGIYI